MWCDRDTFSYKYVSTTSADFCEEGAKISNDLDSNFLFVYSKNNFYRPKYNFYLNIFLNNSNNGAVVLENTVGPPCI